ncbi:50S ribosome-binding GTPase, partial [Candidatus Pacearchaeota archaeon]|nr:50S ribosome-binding GTPase [Candidatus Pacearchaeota archaeon]
MPVNAHPEYTHAEKAYHLADTPEDQIAALETMISFAPAHKGGENLRAQLKTRYKKLKEKMVKAKKSGKSTQVGIKKDDMQVGIIGFTNVGKSSILDKLTNASLEISDKQFTTRSPVIGMMGVESVSIQMIEVPAAASMFFDKGLTNSA